MSAHSHKAERAPHSNARRCGRAILSAHPRDAVPWWCCRGAIGRVQEQSVLHAGLVPQVVWQVPVTLLSVQGQQQQQQRWPQRRRQQQQQLVVRRRQRQRRALGELERGDGRGHARRPGLLPPRRSHRRRGQAGRAAQRHVRSEGREGVVRPAQGRVRGLHGGGGEARAGAVGPPEGYLPQDGLLRRRRPRPRVVRARRRWRSRRVCRRPIARREQGVRSRGRQQQRRRRRRRELPREPGGGVLRGRRRAPLAGRQGEGAGGHRSGARGAALGREPRGVLHAARARLPARRQRGQLEARPERDPAQRPRARRRQAAPPAAQKVPKGRRRRHSLPGYARQSPPHTRRAPRCRCALGASVRRAPLAARARRPRRVALAARAHRPRRAALANLCVAQARASGARRSRSSTAR